MFTYIYDFLPGFLCAACKGMYTVATVTRLWFCVDFILLSNLVVSFSVLHASSSVFRKVPLRPCSIVHFVFISLPICAVLNVQNDIKILKLLLRCCWRKHLFSRSYFVLRVPASQDASLLCVSSVKCALLWEEYLWRNTLRWEATLTHTIHCSSEKTI